MSRMPAKLPRTEGARELLLGLVLGGVLLVGVGLAAWISQSAGNARQEAADILQTLRDKGLAAYWPQDPPEAPTEHWYLVRDERGGEGWAMARRSYDPAGFYHGLTVRGGPGGIDWERWKLAADLSTGAYIAEDTRRARQGPTWRGGTQIVLTDAGLTVRQDTETGPVESHATSVPGNYVPEGALSAVRLLVAQRQTEIQFRMIANDVAPGRGDDEPRFVSGTMEFDGVAERPDAPGARRVSVSLGGRQDIYTIDETGATLRLEAGPVTWQRVERAELARRFPDVRRPDVTLGRIPRLP